MMPDLVFRLVLSPDSRMLPSALWAGEAMAWGVLVHRRRYCINHRKRWLPLRGPSVHYVLFRWGFAPEPPLASRATSAAVLTVDAISHPLH